MPSCERVLAAGIIRSLAVRCLAHQTSRVLDQVEVHTGRPVCSGTTLEGDHTIRAQRGMACTVR